MGVSQREGNYPKNISIMKSKYLTEEVFTEYGASWRDVDYQISIYGPLPAREGVNMQMHCCGKSPQQQSGRAQSKAKQQFRKAKQKTLQKKQSENQSKKQQKAKKSNTKQQSAKNKPMQENQNKIGKTEQKTKIKAKQSEKQRRKNVQAH